MSLLIRFLLPTYFASIGACVIWLAYASNVAWPVMGMMSISLIFVVLVWITDPKDR